MLSSVAARGGTARPAHRTHLLVPRASIQPSPPGQPGDKLLPLLRTPLDLLALGPRVALGALTSLPQVLEKIPTDLERLTMLAQDARPLEEKQVEVLQEVESRVVAYLEKGSSMEGELLGSVSAVLPAPLKDALPQELRDALANPRPAGTDAANGAAASSSGGWSRAQPLATWSLSSADDGEAVFGPPGGGRAPAAAAPDDEAPMTPQQLAASQIAAEVAEVQAAVLAVTQQLEALQANTDASRANMVRLNLREARQGLSRALEEVAPAARGPGASPALAAAIAEAEQLLADVLAVEVAA
eukprot:scaffold11.g3833.t1